MNEDIDYLETVGLKSYLDEFITQSDPSQSIMYNESDIHFIHDLVRKRRSFTTLEFGVGFSTIAIAHALKLNKEDLISSGKELKVRNSNLFRHFVVDSNEFWLNNTRTFFPRDLLSFVDFSYSGVQIVKMGNFQVCSLYDKIPNVVPDFIYLDGPDPKDVGGNINGLSFQCAERTVMSADLLLMESTFLPGTFILVDGRTNNVRFLQNNFKRNYQFIWDKQGDRSSFELVEERLGPFNILGSDIF